MSTLKTQSLARRVSAVFLQRETVEALAKLDEGTPEHAAANFGVREGEPLLLMLDGLLRYAKAYTSRFSEDSYRVLIAESSFEARAFWLALEGVRELLSCSGAVALERGLNDSKSNGVCEEVYWCARRAAGYPDDFQGEEV